MESKRTWFARAAVALAGGATVIALAGPALASHVVVDAILPDGVQVGRAGTVSVTLHADDGARLRGTTVTFYEHASFAGVEGEVEVGRATTDDNGVASITYQPRQAGHNELRTEYTAAGSDEAESAAVVIEATGGGQLVYSPAGVDVPGAGVELVLVLLTVVWAILFRVALRLVAIARAGGRGQLLEVEPTA